MSQTVVNHGTERTESTPPPANPSVLPEQPLVTIEPDRGISAAWLREVWEYRELLFFLAWRDVKVRYKQTVLGILWVIMQPLLMTIIFTVFLGVLVRVPGDGTPFPLMVYVALLPWTFFSSSVTQGSMSIVGNANLITKVYFPRLIIPAAAVAARLVDFAIGFIILFGMMFYYGVGLTPRVLVLPLLVALIALLSLAVGMLVAALNVRYRDVGVVLPVLLQLWMFVSPVLYPTRLVRDTWPHLFRIYSLNPIAGVVDGFRSALLAKPFDWISLGWATTMTLFLLVLSAYAFRRVEKSFADVI